MKTIEFQGKLYPAFQAEGFAAQFAFPFANKLCHGVGVDVGCNRLEWMLPNTEGRVVAPVDPVLHETEEYYRGKPVQDAYNFHGDDLDFIFSSHCLEHLPDWVKALEYWHSKLKSGGIVFLYLPNMDSQNYWRPWNNRKHVHYFNPDMFEKYLESGPFEQGFVTTSDLNCSFYVILKKA